MTLKKSEINSEEKSVPNEKPKDWNSYYEIDNDEKEKYVIQLFGITQNNENICLKVTGFTPFFYVNVPLN
jgi:DNA polymerase elongation subunit (family B)